MLHDEEKALFCLYDLVQLDDVRVLHYSEDVNFARNSLNVVDVVDLPLFKDFDRHALSGETMDTLFDFAEGALT